MPHRHNLNLAKSDSLAIQTAAKDQGTYNYEPVP